MDENELASAFEVQRPYLFTVAYHLLGTVADAEDAVQEAWLRLQRSDIRRFDHFKAWLTQVTARICLDQLRSAHTRRETYVGDWLPEPLVADEAAGDPAEQVTLDDSVGLAMLVVLETLSPAQRTAFVLHDVFGMPFEEIAEVVGRTPASVRQLASRSRRLLHERRPRFDNDPVAQRMAIESFLTAARGGDLEGLVRILDPDVVWRSDGGGRPGAPQRTMRGAGAVARMVVRQAPRYVSHAHMVTVNGALGVAVRSDQELYAVIGFSVHAGLITQDLAVYNPDKLRRVRLG